MTAQYNVPGQGWLVEGAAGKAYFLPGQGFVQEPPASGGVETGTALMSFGGIKFGAAGGAVVTGSGAMAFGGVKFVAIGTSGVFGPAVLSFLGIKIAALGANPGPGPSPENPVVTDNPLSQLQPLTYNVPIVDKNSGTPTPEFQIKWQKQFDLIKAQLKINQTIVPQSYIDQSINNALAVTQAQILALTAYINSRLLPNSVVAALPASPAHGTRGYVTDAALPVFGSAVAGGGAIETPVYFDGTWKVG